MLLNQRRGVKCKKRGKIRRGQIVKSFKSQTDDFIFDPGDDKEPLEFTEYEVEGSDMTIFVC